MADFGVCWRLMFSYFHGLVYMSSPSSMLSLDYIKTWYQLPEAAGIYIYIYILVFLFRTMKRVTLLKTGGSAPCNNDAMVKRPEKSFIWRRFRLKLLKTKDGGHIWTKCWGKWGDAASRQEGHREIRKRFMVVVMVEKSVTGVTAEETRLWGEIMVGDLLCDP